jgi:malonyl-ACP decarboxylase
VSLAAVKAAGLDDSAREHLTVLVAGNNLASKYYAAAVSGFQADAKRVRATHLLDSLDTDCLGAVSEVVGCHHEGWSVGAASASGAVALMHAVRLVAAGAARQCLVVAPVTDLSDMDVAAMRLSGAMAAEPEPGRPAPPYRPFDVERAGFRFGPAAAAVVVENLGDASARGVKPLAAVGGAAQRLDGRRTTQPDSAGQIAAMGAALTAAGLDPADIDYVNAHATGSQVGDATEVAALSTVFAGHRPAVNATKALLGHSLCAAGLVEVVAVALQMAGGYCHGNPHLRTPLSDDLDFVGPDAVDRPIRHALSNSFAFSGINTSVVLSALNQ